MSAELVGGNYTITFPYQADFSGTKNIYVQTNNLKLGNIHVDKIASLIKSIPCTVPPYNFIFYKNQEDTVNMLSRDDIHFIEIRLLDDQLGDIDFLGQVWYMALEIKITAKSYETPESEVPVFQDK
jgi:hypothetical protein